MSNIKKIYLASDHAGFALKEHLRTWLDEQLVLQVLGVGAKVEDLGTYQEERCDYPDFAHTLSERIAEDGSSSSEVSSLGILVCGTGQGMCMAANRHKGIRAVVCSDTFSARMGRLHNNAQVLCLGARVVGQGLAEELVASFLGATFEGGRHELRVNKIDRGDRKIDQGI